MFLGKVKQSKYQYQSAQSKAFENITFAKLQNWMWKLDCKIGLDMPCSWLDHTLQFSERTGMLHWNVNISFHEIRDTLANCEQLFLHIIWVYWNSCIWFILQNLVPVNFWPFKRCCFTQFPTFQIHRFWAYSIVKLVRPNETDMGRRRAKGQFLATWNRCPWNVHRYFSSLWAI